MNDLSSLALSRRRFLTGVAGAAGSAVLVPREAEARATSDLQLELQSFVVPGLHPAHDGLRIAQLSDLHVGRQTTAEAVRGAVAAANQHLPDLVVLTGDYLVHDKAGVALMKEQLGGLRAPAIAVLGNHDHWVDAAGAKRTLVGHGYTVLQNQHETITLRGEPFTVVGVDDLMTRHADVTKSLAGVPKGSRLVLAHIPHTAQQLATHGEPMLVLSGHTHGGQVHIPGVTGPLMAAFGREPYERGRYQVGPIQLYVNRGVGYSGFAIRVNSPPELTILTLRAPGGRG